VARRAWGGLLAAVCVLTLTGCTEIVAGGAVKSPADKDRAIVALIDTGSYPITMGPPPGNAGNDPVEAAGAEALRMAPFIVGPWQVSSELVNQDFMASAPMGTPINLGAALAYPVSMKAWPQHFVDIGKARGFIAGLSTGRTGEGDVVRLQNAVMRFPDPTSAAAGAGELAAVVPADEIQAVSFTPRPVSTVVPAGFPVAPRGLR